MTAFGMCMCPSYICVSIDTFSIHLCIVVHPGLRCCSGPEEEKNKRQTKELRATEPARARHSKYYHSTIISLYLTALQCVPLLKSFIYSDIFSVHCQIQRYGETTQPQSHMFTLRMLPYLLCGVRGGAPTHLDGGDHPAGHDGQPASHVPHPQLELGHVRGVG